MCNVEPTVALFEIVKSKLPLLPPTFTRPKSCDVGVTLIIGPLTAVARSAALEESIPVRSCPWLAAPARPGTNAKVKSPRRTTFRKARLRIACPPSNETQNGEVDPLDSSFNPSKTLTTGCSPPLDRDAWNGDLQFFLSSKFSTFGMATCPAPPAWIARDRSAGCVRAHAQATSAPRPD